MRFSPLTVTGLLLLLGTAVGQFWGTGPPPSGMSMFGFTGLAAVVIGWSGFARSWRGVAARLVFAFGLIELTFVAVVLALLIADAPIDYQYPGLPYHRAGSDEVALRPWFATGGDFGFLLLVSVGMGLFLFVGLCVVAAPAFAAWRFAMAPAVGRWQRWLAAFASGPVLLLTVLAGLGGPAAAAPAGSGLLATVWLAWALGRARQVHPIRAAAER